MVPRPTNRDRPAETERKAVRLTDSLAIALGGRVRAGRKHLRLTQAELAERLGVHQSWLSRIELGRGGSVTLEMWIRLGLALKQPLAVSLSRPIGETRQPADAGHLQIQEALMRRARATGRTAFFELPTRPSDPSRSIDVCVRDARHRVLFIEEAWNTFGDVGGAVRSTNRKAAEASDLAATVDGGPDYRVATVWVVRDNPGNREIIRRFPEIIASAFPGSSREWVDALTTSNAPPKRAGIVWYDASTDQIHEWRRPRPSRPIRPTRTTAILARCAP
jgi:transcriptional regulator with XRE-family HTH domain